MSYHKSIIVGNLGVDPDVKYLDNGSVVAKFSVAATEKWKKDGETMSHTEWYRMECWSNTAKMVETYLRKGDSVLIEARKREEEYNGKYYTKFLIDNIRMLGKAKPAQPSPGVTQPAATAAPVETHPPAATVTQPQQEPENIGPDDLPF
jgi:single-strand DNA-binding protein